MGPQIASSESHSPNAPLAPVPCPGRTDSAAVFTDMIAPAEERVFRLALRITRSPEDAEDVQQETFLKAHRKMGQFEGRSRFTTWISRIAINEALMCLRKRRSNTYVPLEDAMQLNRELPPEDMLHSTLEDPEEAYARKELKNSLERAIAILRPAYRAVFLLRVVEQRSTTETAKVLRISASAVKARMRRARSELKETLQGYENGRMAGQSGGELAVGC